MKIIKLITALLLATGLIFSCIERYYSDYENNFKPQLVIEGTIVPDEGEQEIVISQTASPDLPKFMPVSNCSVQVEDNKGNVFFFAETGGEGHYRGTIDGDKVIIGNKYRLLVHTPQGNDYRSSYEELLPCPPIDSLYFELANKPTNDPANTLNGLQFFVDFKANENYGAYYRYELIETYEYHSRWPLQRWRDEYDVTHKLEYPDFSAFVCYNTSTLRDIFNLSTDGFSQNSYARFRLHFVKDQTPKLKIKYSLLVNQYSIDKNAFIYWENLRKNNQETADLFGKQPAVVKGNIYNVKDTAEVALGYFGVSSVQSKRVMVLPFDGLSFDHSYVCKAAKIYVLPKKELVYYVTDYDEDGTQYVGLGDPGCIFCYLLGGSTVKPPYWDEQ